MHTDTKEQHERHMAQIMADRAERERDARRPRVNLSALPPAEKARVWTHLQQRHPAVAALLQDPSLGELRRAFDALVMIDAELLAGADHERY